MRSTQKLPISRVESVPKAADQRHQGRHAGRGRDEILHREPEHLGQVAHRRLAAVALPVGVGGEAHGRVEGGIGRDAGEALRVQREDALQTLEAVDRQCAEPVEEQHRDRIGLPVHPLVGMDAADAVDQTLDRAEHGIEERPLAVVDVRHEGPERFRERDQDDEVEPYLEESVRGHQNSSGFRRATKR